MIDPRIALLEGELERRRAELGSAMDAVPAGRRGVLPPEGGWSVAMVLEHLTQTERSVTRLLGRLTGDAPVRPREETFTKETFLGHVHMPLFLDRTRKLKGSQPTGSLSAEDAWDELHDTRRAFLEVLRDGAGRRLEDVSYDHPVGTTLDGYRWAAFVALHEARHAAQILEIHDLVRPRSERG